MKSILVTLCCSFCLFFLACPGPLAPVYVLNAPNAKVLSIRIDSIKKSVTPTSLEAKIYFKYLDTLKRNWDYYDIYMEAPFYTDKTHQRRLGIGATRMSNQLGCTSNCATLASGLNNIIFVDSMGVVTVAFRSVEDGKDFSAYQAMDVDSCRLVYSRSYP